MNEMETSTVDKTTDTRATRATGGARWQAAARAELSRLQDWLDRLQGEQHALQQRGRERTLTADERQRLADLATEVETLGALVGRAAARLPGRESNDGSPRA